MKNSNQIGLGQYVECENMQMAELSMGMQLSFNEVPKTLQFHY